MQLFFRTVPPPTLLLFQKNVALSKTQRGCRHDNLVSTLGVAQVDPQCEPRPI